MQSKKHKELESKITNDTESIKSPVKNSKITKSPRINEDQIIEESVTIGEDDSKNWEDIAENEDIEIGN